MNGTIDYIISKEILENFCKEALKNKSPSGHIETLALVTGYWNGINLIADGLIFPKQQGNSTEVEDLGNNSPSSILLHYQFFISIRIKVEFLTSKKGNK